jgi:hypothetical protein
MPKPLISGTYKIQKMEGKGGWTFILIPWQAPKTDLPFGWFVVKGKIDNYEIKQFKLWPTKDGQLFLPLKAAIRKAIKKDVGQSIAIELYKDDSEIEIPDEFIICVQESPKAWSNFEKMSSTSKKQFVDFVYETKNIETRAKRIIEVIEKLELNKKYHQK